MTFYYGLLAGILAGVLIGAFLSRCSSPRPEDLRFLTDAEIEAIHDAAWDQLYARNFGGRT